jgi:hypothetical protein
MQAFNHRRQCVFSDGYRSHSNPEVYFFPKAISLSVSHCHINMLILEPV